MLFSPVLLRNGARDEGLLFLRMGEQIWAVVFLLGLR